MTGRIRQLIENQRISTRAFELKIGASNGLIRKAIANNTDIQGKWIVAIAENYPQISADWLLLGNGPMYRSGMEPVGLMSAEEMDRHDREVAEGKWLVHAVDNQGCDVAILKDMLTGKDAEIGRLNRELGAYQQRIRDLKRGHAIYTEGIGGVPYVGGQFIPTKKPIK